MNISCLMRELLFKTALLGTFVGSSGAVFGQTIGTPPIVIRSNGAGSIPIWAQDRAGAPVGNEPISIQSPGGFAAQPGFVNPTASTSQVNGNAVVQPSTIVVRGNPPCPASPASWTVAGNTCTSTLPGVNSGASAIGTDSLVPTLGSASFACLNGVFAATPEVGSTCILSQCGSQTLSWGSPVCSATYPATNSGGSAVMASANGNTGSATYLCSGNSWVYQSGSCSAPAPKGCRTPGLGQVPWGDYAVTKDGVFPMWTFTEGWSQDHGTAIMFTSIEPYNYFYYYTGAVMATYICTNGSWVLGWGTAWDYAGGGITDVPISYCTGLAYSYCPTGSKYMPAP